MTIVVGIRCVTDVIIGTDSAAMVTAATHQPTIQQSGRQKIEIIQDQVIVAGTGEVGLGQRFVDTVEHSWDNPGFQQASVMDIGRSLSRDAIGDFSQTGAPKNAYGALVAVPCRDAPELIEFAVTNLQPEVKSKGNWYVSMGIGQSIADPLLEFLCTIFWSDELPSRQDGLFAATMVLQLTCSMAPSFVSEPIQIAVLGPNEKNQLSARRLSEDELLEHKQNVNDAMEHFKSYRDVLHGKRNGMRSPTQSIPKSPFRI